MIDEDKNILINYLLSLNDKTSEFSDKNNQKDILLDENTNKRKIYNEDDTYFLNIKDNVNKEYIGNDNRKKNELLLPLDNEINKDIKTTSLKDLSIRNRNKKIFSNRITSEPKNNNIKVDNDYNKSFKNRMDIMQAVLDDELNISSENKNFRRRRVKSRTTVKLNEKKLKNIKPENRDYDNKLYDKEEIKEINDNNEFNKKNFKNNIEEKEEKKKKTIINNYQNEYLNNKEEIKLIKDINNKEKEQKVKNKEEEKEKRKLIAKLSNLMESSEKMEENYNTSYYPNNANKITEEINFEIFNDKHKKRRKASYIDINFNDKNTNNKNKGNHKINSERMKSREKSQYIYTNRNNNTNINKFKTNYNKSYINKKEYKNINNSINNKDKRNSGLPFVNKFYDIINNNIYYMIKKDEANKNNSKKIFPESLDNLINKIKKTCEEKKDNSFKVIKSVNNYNRINKRIKDIEDSLQKINDINKENENLFKENNTFNKRMISFNVNNICNIDDDSYKTKNRNISNNIYFSKRADSSDYILHDKIKTFNNSKNNTNNKTNSYSKMNTLNNSSSPMHGTFKNKKKIFTIKNININNLKLMNKNLKVQNIIEDLDSHNLLTNINISERTNSKNTKEDKNTNTKNYNILNNRNNNNNYKRLYYTTEKAGSYININSSLPKTNSSKLKEHTNKLNINNLIKDYPILNEFSKEKKDEHNADFINRKINYKNETVKRNNNHLFSSSSNNTNDLKYIYNNTRKKNKIKQIQNYSNKTKDNYIHYKKYNYKNMLSPFEKLRRNKVHSIFPVNPFDEINYIKERNFLIN